MGQPRPKKRIILLRHADKKGLVLSQEGHEKARLIGEKVLRGMVINLVIPSLYTRAIETAVGLLRGMRDGWFGGEDGMAIKPRNVTGVTMAEWIKHLDRGESIAAIEKAYPEFMGRAYALLDAAFAEIISDTEHGGTTLVVTHSPCLEATVRVLTRTPEDPKGTLIATPMEYCEGVILIIWDDDTVTVEKEIRHAA